MSYTKKIAEIVEQNMKKTNAHKNCAFTLAEVLITLGVIGIVAAMTIPVLVNSYQKTQTITQLKEVYSQLNNAMALAKVDNGTDVNAWDLPNSSLVAAETYFAQTYLMPYLKVIQDCGTTATAACSHDVGYTSNLSGSTNSFYTLGGASYYSFTLANGAIVTVQVFSQTGQSVGESRVYVYMDVNGRTVPNIMGKDTFLVELGYGTNDKSKFYPYAYSMNRLSLMTNGDGPDCNRQTGNGARCFALVMKDGWKIADDYPW